MDQLKGIGSMLVDGKTMLLPCGIREENSQIWIHFLDQNHVVFLGMDRSEIIYTDHYSDKNSVICSFYHKTHGWLNINVFLNKAGYDRLYNFCLNDWVPSYQDTDYDLDTDSDTDIVYEPMDTNQTSEPMDTDSDDETSVEDNETSAKPRGWFSWFW